MSASSTTPTTPQRGSNKCRTSILLSPEGIKRINQPTPFSSPTLLKENEITPGITRKEYAQRRDALFDKMKLNSILILPAAPQKYMSPDIVYRYRQNPDFLYLTGFIEPSAVLILHKESKTDHHFYLFVTEFDEKTLTYDGHVAGTEAARAMFGVDETYNLQKLDHTLKRLIESRGYGTVYFNTLPKILDAETINFRDIPLHQRIEHILEKCVKKSQIKKIGTMIAKLRLIKSPQELALMRESSKIAAISMREMIESVTPEVVEDRLAAMFEFGCRMRGASRLSAPVTISHGAENNILHYLNNDRVIADGTLALMDTGAEYFGYSSDITRVFPTNGRYSDAQMRVYNLVLDVQQTIISQYCVVGKCIKILDAETDRLLKEGLKALDILVEKEEEKNEGEMLSMSSRKRKKRKIDKDECGGIEAMWHSGGVHFVSHWIGMDIHDCNDIGHRTKFEAGMCIAVEPGIYLPDHENIKPEYRNIGVRIEDTIAITEGEAEVLTKDCPKDPQKIMALMQSNPQAKRDGIWKDAKQGLWSPNTKRKVRTKLFRNEDSVSLPFWN